MWYVEGECENCGYYEIVDEDKDAESEDIFCMSPMAEKLHNNRIKPCPSFVKKGIEIIPKPRTYDKTFLYLSDFKNLL